MSNQPYPKVVTADPQDAVWESLRKVVGLLATSIGANGGVVLNDGDGITIAYVDPGVEDSVLSLSNDGREFIVSLATDENGEITTTAAEVASLLNASPQSSALFTAANKAGNDGTGVVTAMNAVTFAAGTATTALTGNNNDLDFTANDTATGPFRAVCAIGGDAVVSALVVGDEWGGGDLGSLTMTDGVVITIGVSSITRTSGTIACYY